MDEVQPYDKIGYSPDPYTCFIYAIHSPETKKRYPQRMVAFFDYMEISGHSLPVRLFNFYKKAKSEPLWLQNALMEYITLQRERVKKYEIAASTVTNFYKPIKLFCDMNDILINWKMVSRGLLRGKHAADDRPHTHPTEPLYHTELNPTESSYPMGLNPPEANTDYLSCTAITIE